MTFTRRSFLAALGAVLGAAAVAPLVARKVPGWEDLPEVDAPDAPAVFEDEAASRWTRARVASDEPNCSSLIEIDVDAADYRCDDAMLCARTGEVMRVVSVAPGKVSVVRGTAGTTLAGVLDRDWMLRLR